jgi:hypothetical protein
VTEPSTATPEPVAATLRAAVWLLAGQAVAVAVVAAILVYEDFVATATTMPGALALTGSAAAIAAILGLLCWALARRHSWARGPAVVLELMLLPIGYYMIKGGIPWLGVPVLLLGTGTAALLIAPGTRAALSAR